MPCCVIYFTVVGKKAEIRNRGRTGQFGAVLKIEYMSEEDDDPNGEGWCHLRLNWRAEFFQTLDSRASANRKEFMKERTKRTSSGESRKRAPTDTPACRHTSNSRSCCCFKESSWWPSN